MTAITNATVAPTNGDQKAAPAKPKEPKQELHPIHKALPLIIGAVLPIAKSKENKSQGYKFRGVDDVYAMLNLLLEKYGVSILPEVMEATRDSHASKSGGVLFRCMLRVRYHLIASDGTSLTTVVEGEGMDSGDKATPKALSAAYKYMAFQVFCIPTGEKIDTEEESPEVAAPPPPPAKPITVPKHAPRQPQSLSQQVVLMAKEYGYPTGEHNKDLWAFCAKSLNNKPSKDWTDNDFNTLEAALAEAVTVLKEQNPPAPFKPEEDISF